MDREKPISLIERYLRSHPIVALLGPRQCGKTTLAKMFCKKYSPFPQSNYFDLESSIDLQRLKNPLLSLKPLTNLIVIDEIQRSPDLFPTLRVLVDEETSTQKYLILGSASKELLRQSSESLAGRIAYIELTPFSLQEAGEWKKLWIRGGFPKSFLAKTEEESFDWRTFYIRTFLEQDIPNLGIKIPPETLQRFWIMLAHYHGNIFNSSEFARSFGTSDATIRKYLDILTGTFMVRQLQPWHENLGKRQVKASKIYFRDSGILHALCNIQNSAELLHHPKIGASWEGFALEEVIRHFSLRGEECYFWSTYGGAELDLFFIHNNKRIGIEFKYSDAPSLTKSMQIAVTDLKLDHLFVLYPGTVDYPLTEKIEVKTLAFVS